MLVDAFGRRNKERPRWSKIEIAIFGCTRDGSRNSPCQRVFSITKRATTLPSKSQCLPLYRRRSALLPQMPGNNVDRSVPVEVFPRQTLWTTPPQILACNTSKTDKGRQEIIRQITNSSISAITNALLVQHYLFPSPLYLLPTNSRSSGKSFGPAL